MQVETTFWIFGSEMVYQLRMRVHIHFVACREGFGYCWNCLGGGKLVLFPGLEVTWKDLCQIKDLAVQRLWLISSLGNHSCNNCSWRQGFDHESLAEALLTASLRKCKSGKEEFVWPFITKLALEIGTSYTLLLEKAQRISTILCAQLVLV